MWDDPQSRRRIWRLIRDILLCRSLIDADSDLSLPLSVQPVSEPQTTPAISDDPATAPSDQTRETQDVRSSTLVSPSAKDTSRPTASSLPSATGTTWTVFKQTLKITEKFTDAFPPLKAAVSSLVIVLDRIDMINEVQEDLTEVKTRLDGFFDVIRNHQHPDSYMCSHVDGFARTLEVQKLSIADKLERGMIKRVIEASDDKAEILRHIRTIGYLVDQFMMATALNTDANITVLLKDAKFARLDHVPEAAFNGPHSDGKGCMAGTRATVLANLVSWAVDPEAPPIYWLTGLAGTGKSAIAYSLCRVLDDSGLLGASFFCSRQSSLARRNIYRILPTLAYLLAQNNFGFASALLRSLETVPDAGKLSLDVQCRSLLLTPCSAAFSSTARARILVVDALDECEDQDGVSKFVQFMMQHAKALKLKVFITSRPESQIKHEFGHLTSDQVLYLHHIEDSLVKADIRNYLKQHLTAIFEKHYWSRSHQPSLRQIEILTNLSDKLFIYAFTVLKYIGWKNADPEQRLDILASKNVLESRDIMVDQLHVLYQFILQDAFQGLNQKEKMHQKSFLACILSQFRPMSIQTISEFLDVQIHQMSAIMGGFHAILDIPSDNHGSYVLPFHASLEDYVTNKTLNHQYDWCIDIAEAHSYMLKKCFDIMEQELKFNISGCKTSYLANDEQELTPLSEKLVYACTYWPEHFVRTSDQQNFILHLDSWLHTQLLYWLEVVSANKTVNQCLISLRTIYYMCKRTLDNTSSDLMSKFDEILQFLNIYKEPISRSIPHIYISALAFGISDFTSLKYYAERYSKLFSVHHNFQSLQLEQPALVTLNGHDSIVNSVSVSKSGQYIASGSDDMTIRIWKIATGTALGQPLRGHTQRITSVSFSSDELHVVSGSSDRTIKLWNIITGYIIQNYVYEYTVPMSVAFSPDNKYIVSGYQNSTIVIWKTDTGEAVIKKYSTLENIMSINSVAFSPDGQYIVSGSDDSTVRIWRADTGEPIRKCIRGHTSSVNSVSFSSDGQYIASGANDNTIYIWKTDTGEAVRHQLKGHTGEVMSVTFSPDNQYIISGSFDQTVKIWRVDTCETVGRTIEEHQSWISSVAVSSGGQYIISGSADNTIRLWSLDSYTNTDQYEINAVQGHKEGVSTVAFSSDGKYIVSGSYDGTIRTWKVTGAEAVLETTIKGYSYNMYMVSSVAISPDSNYIASSSFDSTIRIWSILTGEIIGKPIEGHTNQITSVSFSPNGQCIVSASYDYTIRIWKVDTGEAAISPIKCIAWISSVKFSPDGQYIAAALTGGIRIWKTSTGEAAGKLFEGHTSCISSIAYSPDGQYIVSGSWDKTVQMWKIDTGKAVGLPIQGHTDIVTCVAFSSDGHYIASGSKDWTIRIWKADTGAAIGEPLQGHTIDVTSIAFSPDGQFIVSGSLHQYICIWPINLKKYGPELSFKPTFSGTIELNTIEKSIWRVIQEQKARPWAQVGFKGYAKQSQSFGSWITGPNSELLMWIPRHYLHYLHWPHNAYVMGCSKVTLDLGKFVHGEDWIECHLSTLL